MTDSENIRRGLHDAVDCCLDALERLDQHGQAAVKWGKALIQLISSVTIAARTRSHGRATLDATFAEGAPVATKAIEAGFLASVK